VRHGDHWMDEGKVVPVSRFTWREWDVPVWRARRRPVFDSLRVTWRDLERRVAEEGH
jgi:hypothetical protein